MNDELQSEPEPVASIVAPVEERPRLSWEQQVWQLVAVALLAFGAYSVVTHFVLQSVQVVGVSMSPTLHDADKYLLNRLAYHIRQPKYNDIVVIKDPTDGVFVVKRIIAKPGDSVLFKNGRVYVNGAKLWEPYLTKDNLTFTYSPAAEQLIVCGKDQYFVLGDNRQNSYDSRMYGPVRRQNILGVVSL